MNKHIRRIPLYLAGLAMSLSAFAMDEPQYDAMRQQYRPVAISTVNGTSIKGLPALKVFETLGVVKQVSDKTPVEFTLTDNNGLTLTFIAAKPDADIVVGAPLRVLGRMTDDGKYESLAVTRIDITKIPVPEAAAPAAPPTPPVDTTPANADAPAVVPAPTPAAAKPAPEAQPDPKPETKPAPAPAAIPDQKPTAQPAPAAKPDAKPVAKPAAKPAAKPTPKPAPAPKKAAPKPSFASQVNTYAAKIRQFNKKISAATAKQIASAVLVKSQRYSLDPRLVFAVIAQESRFNPQAVSPVGAQGLGQLMPATAKGLGVSSPFDIAQNVEGTVRYLSSQLKRFGGNVTYALAAYNAGPGNVQRYKGVPPFKETLNYVQTISAHFSKLLGELL